MHAEINGEEVHHIKRSSIDDNDLIEASSIDVEATIKAIYKKYDLNYSTEPSDLNPIGFTNIQAQTAVPHLNLQTNKEMDQVPRVQSHSTPKTEKARYRSQNTTPKADGSAHLNYPYTDNFHRRVQSHQVHPIPNSREMNSNGYLDYKQNQLSFESMAYESINKPRIPELLGSNVPENFKQHQHYNRTPERSQVLFVDSTGVEKEVHVTSKVVSNLHDPLSPNTLARRVKYTIEIPNPFDSDFAQNFLTPQKSQSKRDRSHSPIDELKERIQTENLQINKIIIETIEPAPDFDESARTESDFGSHFAKKTYSYPTVSTIPAVEHHRTNKFSNDRPIQTTHQDQYRGPQNIPTQYSGPHSPNLNTRGAFAANTQQNLKNPHLHFDYSKTEPPSIATGGVRDGSEDMNADVHSIMNKYIQVKQEYADSEGRLSRKSWTPQKNMVSEKAEVIEKPPSTKKNNNTKTAKLEVQTIKPNSNNRTEPPRETDRNQATTVTTSKPETLTRTYGPTPCLVCIERHNYRYENHTKDPYRKEFDNKAVVPQEPIETIVNQMKQEPLKHQENGHRMKNELKIEDEPSTKTNKLKAPAPKGEKPKGFQPIKILIAFLFLLLLGLLGVVIVANPID